MQVIKKSTYRQRVYQMADGSVQLIFGEDVAPIDANGNEGKLLADHDITDTAIVADHVEPPASVQK